LNKFLRTDLLAVADPSTQMTQGGGASAAVDSDLKVRDALDRAAQKIAGKFRDQPLVEAELRETIGSAYLGLGVYTQAEEQLDRALRLRRQLQSDSSEPALKTMTLLAMSDMKLNKLAPAEKLLTKVVASQKKTHPSEDKQNLEARSLLGALLVLQKKYPEAEQLLAEVEAGERRVFGENAPETLYNKATRASLLKLQGKKSLSDELLGSC
jgi:eukaryotic-like serine/threonine-protein kinase